MRIRRQALSVSTLLATLALFVGFVIPPAHASPIADDDTGDQPVSANAPSVNLSRSSARELEPTGYWTEEKMRSAIPADKLAPEFYQTDTNPSDERSKRLSLGEDLSDPVYPELSPGQQTRNAVVPSTAGKVFFSYKGKNYVCSGSAINGPTKNVVSTAGHCVHGGKGEGWHSNIAFAPAYYNGASGYGLWNWKTAYTFTGWTNSSDFSRDQAFFTVHPRNGRTLVATVGGNGLSYNYGHNQTGVRIWGWPAEKPYDGTTPYYCDGNTKKWGFWSRDMIMPCDMTGGASGDPWLRTRIDANLGYVFGVTSRRTTSGSKLLISTPFDDAVKNLFRGIK
ncbi:hypothetical protein V3M81_09475 [Trueperella pyogenes]|uniref:trypsin-like serine peptidase n=1 Tax=Trueperella pyogenes TaxID=1661 RepID=UPI00345C92D7